ncbi:uncharacterized protein LOC118230177 [Anguilla anguilla]|uniref:uncharacterized protein LOC118230177 n=1 Tax=Anguilla anguilla TaxID=7936 RepID=UPI0015AB774C|nr:uncharacterized protein LOC118230177 [Anguilla anguilla]
MGPVSPPMSLSICGTSDETHTDTSDYSPRAADNRRKRKAKTDVSSMMGAFMDIQKKQYDEFNQAEQLRQQQEKDSLDAWIKSRMEIEERRLQAQREECQETNRMFMQKMSRLFDVMVPSSQQHTPSHLQPPPPHYYQGPPLHYTAHEETPLTFRELHGAAEPLPNAAQCCLSKHLINKFRKISVNAYQDNGLICLQAVYMMF